MRTNRFDEVDYDGIYLEAIRILDDIRLTAGPLAVRGTLQKHPELKKFLTIHQKSVILSLEAKVS